MRYENNVFLLSHKDVVFQLDCIFETVNVKNDNK
jgi:hypothetical protein